MFPRTTLIAVLVGVEIALVGAMVTAVRGDGSAWTFADHARATGPRNYRFAADPNTNVTIAIGYADLRIDTAPGSHIDVGFGEHGMSWGHLAPLSATESGNTVRIASTDPDGAGFMGNDSRLVHVTVPPATRVTVEFAGDITASGLRAPASFNSSNGKIDVTDFRGALIAASSEGHVLVTDSDCTTLQASSSNGHVELRRVTAGHIDASSDNGRVVGTAVELHDGSISSSNGHVSLGLSPNSDTTVSAATSDGTVSVSGFAYTAAAARGGDGDDDSSAKTVRIGAGLGRLDVRSSNGNIDLIQEG